MRDSITRYVIEVLNESTAAEAIRNPVKFVKAWLALSPLPDDAEVQLRIKGKLRFISTYKALALSLLAFAMIGCGMPHVSHGTVSTGKQTPPPTSVDFYILTSGNGSGTVQYNNAAPMSGMVKGTAMPGEVINVTISPDAASYVYQLAGFDSISNDQLHASFTVRSGVDYLHNPLSVVFQLTSGG